MAGITIHQFPSENVFCLSPIIYVVSSTANSETNFEYVLEVRVWSGSSSSVPTDATYTLSKLPNALSSAAFDVAKLIRSKVTFSNLNAIITGTAESVAGQNESRWLRVTATYTSDDSTATPSNSSTELILRGYTSAADGVNADNGTPAVLSSLGDNVSYPDSAPMIAAVLTNVVRKVRVTNANFTYEIDLSSYVSSPETTASIYVYVRIGTDWFGGTGLGYQLNYWQTDGATIEAQGCLDNDLTRSDSYTIEYLNVSDVAVKTNVIQTACEGKYTQGLIMYTNKFGGVDSIPANLVSRETLVGTKQTFQNKAVSVTATSAVYTTTAHRTKTFDTQAKKRVMVTTGYQPEAINAMIEQMLVSHNVWYWNGTALTPVQLADSEIRLQQHQTEKLINYQMNFDHADDIVNDLTI